MNAPDPLRDWRTAAAPKGFRDGTHRLVPPEETLSRVAPLLPALGITRVANVTGLDVIGVPVVMVCRPNSRSLATSQGKGLTLAAAKVSGIMESIELHHAEHIASPLLFGSHDELRGRHTLVDVDGLPSIRNSRYSSALQLLWIEGFDLLRRRRVWVPFEVVHASAKVPPPPGSGCFSATSNGLASGNHAVEAMLHGLYELVERDATTLWQRRPAWRRAETELDLSTVDDPACREVLQTCERAGVAVAVWETTSDAGLPSFLCEIRETVRGPSGDVSGFSGMGTHAARGVALLRALTEAVQCRLTLISGSRDDLFRREYANVRRSEHVASRGRDGAKATRRSFRDVADLAGPTLVDDLCRVLDRLERMGLSSVIAVDLTRPEVGIPVVRMVVPGLEGPDEDPEYVPGPRALASAAGR